MISIDDLPSLNAVLNGTSAVLLALGYLFIRLKKVDLQGLYGECLCPSSHWRVG